MLLVMVYLTLVSCLMLSREAYTCFGKFGSGLLRGTLTDPDSDLLLNLRTLLCLKTIITPTMHNKT